MLHDESVYGEDLEAFRPERFMKGDQLDPSIPAPMVAFGFGRRICPGQDAAEATVWITIASLVSAFDMTGKKGWTRRDYGEYRNDGTLRSVCSFLGLHFSLITGQVPT
jgi:cytochrome P450